MKIASNPHRASQSGPCLTSGFAEALLAGGGQVCITSTSSATGNGTLSPHGEITSRCSSTLPKSSTGPPMPVSAARDWIDLRHFCGLVDQSFDYHVVRHAANTMKPASPAPTGWRRRLTARPVDPLPTPVGESGFEVASVALLTRAGRGDRITPATDRGRPGPDRVRCTGGRRGRGAPGRSGRRRRT